MSTLIVWFSLAVGLAVATVMSAGLGELIGNRALHRTITGAPREWFSAEALYRRRQGLREMLGPAVVAFGASAACNVGTTLLVNDYQAGQLSLASPGVYWLYGGVVAIVIAILALIARPVRTPWELARSYESLLLYMDGRGADNGQPSADALRERLEELDTATSLSTSKRTCAGKLFPVPDDAISARPRRVAGPLAAPDGTVLAPRWRDVWSWTLKFRRVMASFLFLTFLLLTLWAVVYAGVDDPKAHRLTMVVELALVVSAWSLCFGLRLDLMWWSRLDTESRIFRHAVEARLMDLEASAATVSNPIARRGEMVVAFGRYRVTRETQRN